MKKLILPIFSIFLVCGFTIPIPAKANDTEEQQRGCEQVSCQMVDPSFIILLPNPLSCESFCSCEWGKAYYRACPTGLHFNANLQVCDYPQNANCTTQGRKSVEFVGGINIAVQGENRIKGFQTLTKNCISQNQIQISSNRLFEESKTSFFQEIMNALH